MSASDIARMQQKQPTQAKPSKYRNERCATPDGQKFDSKKEAAAWLRLSARQQAGEIRNLQRQVKYPLYCPSVGHGAWSEVAAYVADFVYDDANGTHVVDVKGGQATRTQVYRLKRRWLELQHSITIEEL